MKYLNSKKGFTLIELMIVVVIIVVLIAIAGTTWLLSLNHLSLRNDAVDIKSALQKARSWAINSTNSENSVSRSYQVYFDIANEIYQIEICNLNAAGIPDSTGTNCNIAPTAPNFAGSGNTHGTVVGSLRNLSIASFGHKPINIVGVFDGGGNAVNCIRFNIDGTAIFFNNGMQSGSTTLDINLARTDNSQEPPKTIEINSNTGMVNVL